jgi:hypothetical protein
MPQQPDGPVHPNHFDWTLQFEREPAILASQYWKSRCDGRPMPSRSDLDPTAMRKFSNHVGLIDIRPASGSGVDYLIRRAGSKWEEIYGPMTGRSLHEFLPPPIEQSWREVFDAVRNRGMPARITSCVDFEGKTWHEIEMFVAPLGENGQVTMLMMAFVSWSTIGD